MIFYTVILLTILVNYNQMQKLKSLGLLTDKMKAYALSRHWLLYVG
jgi:hypothetical protein